MIPEPWDIELREGAMRLARHLLACGAVRYDPNAPFRFSSGLVSPVRLETRRLLSYPAIRREVVDLAVRMIENEIDAKADGERRPLDAIVAAEGAGVPFATLIADRLGLPLLLVRKNPPEGAVARERIIGRLEPGWRLLLIEQLATDGHRKIRFAEPLRAAGGRLNDIFVLFQYGIFDSIQEHLAPLGIRLHALATWWDLLEVADDVHLLSPQARDEIHAYLRDPHRWCERHQAA